MEAQVAQVVQAIAIASDPARGPLHQQALDFLKNIQDNAATAWRLALAIFVETASDGVRKHPLQARFWALRVLDEFFDNRFDLLDMETFTTVQQAFVGYIQTEYVTGPAESGAPFLRNKFSHTLTLFFLCTYTDQWPSFFQDIFTLIRPSESSSASAFNPHVSLLLFHLVSEISGEVADNLIKSARTFTNERHKRDGRVRDAVRERDAPRINEAVVTIVASYSERMRMLRAGAPGGPRELDEAVEVVDWGVRTFGSYVGWIDISLTVTQQTIELLFSLLSDASLPIRLATSVALLRILSKGLKEPGDKLQLIKVLSLGQVISELEKKTKAEQAARGSNTDEGEESYREALGRLLNVLGLELIKLDEDGVPPEVRSEAIRLLAQTLPVLLSFIADDYDDTSNTVFPFLQTVLSGYKRARKLSSDAIDDEKRSFLTMLLDVLLQKMKWDGDEDPDDLDEDDRAAFEELRKDLRTFTDSVLVIDQDLVTRAVHNVAMNTLTAYSNSVSLSWNDVELAVYLVYIFGEINKTGGKGPTSFCQAPPKEQRTEGGYAAYPLTAHGEMLFAMIQSNVSAYPHKAVVMQFFETVARYTDFFKVRKECIVPTLEAMVDIRGMHNPDSAVRSRVFYLFHRFIRECRNDVGLDISMTILEGVRDLLVLNLELPELENPEEQDMLTEATNQPQAQLYLFETIGTLISLFSKAPEQQAALLLSVVQPLLDNLQTALQTPITGPQDVLPILTAYRAIMAMGSIAKGFPDYPTTVPQGYIPPPVNVFQQMANAILVSLDAMTTYKVVREATRAAFARILETMGPSATHLVPPLMNRMLTHFDSTELVDFMNFIGLLVHRLQMDMFDTLDVLLGPLSARIMEVLVQPVAGTDDQLQHNDTKRAYLTLLNTIMQSNLHSVFLSDRNQGQLEGLLTGIQRLAMDVSDPTSEKTAFVFLSRCVTAWGRLDSTPGAANGAAALEPGVPGFDQFLYKQLVPMSFQVLSLPKFNIKDGQIMLVLQEIANFLQTVCKTRGQEAIDFFLNVFLPAQGWPAATATEFTTKLRDLDPKGFRRYFADMVRSSRA